MDKNPPASAEDTGLIPGLRRFPQTYFELQEEILLQHKLAPMYPGKQNCTKQCFLFQSEMQSVPFCSITSHSTPTKSCVVSY